MTITPNVNTGRNNKIINLKEFKETLFEYACKKQSRD
jgi:hypothetical protein